ncbi:MAG: hypothetical protein VKO21_00930 [Candidatus Sericytochromatia bacterium]|nr:hypothetical protein [Candidatus Sericytochromatia bacterium]
MRRCLILSGSLALVLGLPLVAHAAPPGTGERPLMARLLDGLGFVHERDSDGDYKLIFQLDDGRSQMVWINGETETYGPYEIHEIWSPAHRFKGKLPEAESFLEDSQVKKLGAWQMRRISEDERVLIFVAKVPGPPTEASLRAVLQLVIDVADSTEARLSGGKDNL